MTSPLQPSTTVDTLPKQFVKAMRTLFDIMDDKTTGFVNLSEIEKRWQDDESKGLPKGVIESLRKVTPPNGLLSFERFCAGLKICLLRNQIEHQNQCSIRPQQNQPEHNGVQKNRPPSAPLLDLEEPIKPNWPNSVAMWPNYVNPQQRTISMPQLLNERKENIPTDINTVGYDKPLLNNINKPTTYGPPKPPRVAIGNLDRAEIRTALQNWQMGQLMNDQELKNGKANQYNGLLRTNRSLGDGKAAVQPDIKTTTGQVYQKKSNPRKREPRRHTLQNGVDYNMLKRMKQIEQEKDILMQGLAAIEKSREWYLKQIGSVQEKMKYLGRMGHVEPWSEAQQERLELQRARVLEVNRHLAVLTDSWERGGLPLHINLAVNHHPQPQYMTDRLKQQNHILTEEVNKKNEKITMLEREKANLIRELLQNRAPQRNEQEEAVF